jgi:hypothetical protein
MELEKRLGEDEMRSGNDSSSIYIPGAGIAKSLFQEWYEFLIKR